MKAVAGGLATIVPLGLERAAPGLVGEGALGATEYRLSARNGRFDACPSQFGKCGCARLHVR